jgi:hypothetical protein
LWRGNQTQNALLAAADALDAVETFSQDQSRQAERSHQFARAIVGLFFAEGDATPPPFSFGQASHLEPNSAELNRIDLKPLADNWRILAAVEAKLGVDVGIDARSMAKQTGSLIASVERLIRIFRYAASLESGDLERALRAGVDLIHAAKISHNDKSELGGIRRIDASKYVIGDPRELVADSTTLDAIQFVLLDLFLARLTKEPIDRAFLTSLRDAATKVFGEVAGIDAVLRAAETSQSTGQTIGRAEMLARGIAMSAEDVGKSPANRFYRDMMIAAHLPFSLAQSQLIGLVGTMIALGWIFVLGHQRFLLRNAEESAPAIEAAIAKIDKDGIEAIAELLLATSDTVEHWFAEGWIQNLKALVKAT